MLEDNLGIPKHKQNSNTFILFIGSIYNCVCVKKDTGQTILIMCKIYRKKHEQGQDSEVRTRKY